MAAIADTTLEIRDRCNEGIQCPAPQITGSQIKSVIGRNFETEFNLDIYIKNPSRQEVISAQTWLEYDKSKLQVAKIDVSNSAFDFVAPGENHFDNAE